MQSPSKVIKISIKHGINTKDSGGKGYLIQYRSAGNKLSRG